jgi:hypothetical protein
VSWTTLIVQREGAALEQAGEEIKKPFFALHFLIPFTNSYIALLQIPGLVPRPIVYNALTPFANLLKNALREGLDDEICDRIDQITNNLTRKWNALIRKVKHRIRATKAARAEGEGHLMQNPCRSRILRRRLPHCNEFRREHLPKLGFLLL